MRLLVIVAVCLSSVVVAAQEVGRKFDWQDSTSPNFPETLPKKDDKYTLPPIATPSDEVRQDQNLSQSPKLFVKNIVIKDVTVFTPDEISAIAKPYIGRIVALEELQALRLELSKKYVERGYVNSGVVIPEQKPTDGTIVMRAVEGDLTRIDIADETHLSNGYLSKRIRRHVDDPLNINDLQYALQWVQMDQNINRLDARLAPGDSPGESVLMLAVDEPRRISFGITADNHGSTSVGSERGRATLSFRNLTGLGEVLRASAGLSEGADDGSASLSLPLNRWNTRVQAYYASSNSKIIEQQFEVLDIQSDTETRGISLTHPLIDDLNTSLILTLGAEKKSSSTELLGVPFSLSPGAIDGVSETAPVVFGLDWTRRKPNKVTSLRATYRRGVDMFNVTKFEPANSFAALFNPTGADAEFEVFLIQGLYLYRLNELGLFSSLDSRGQLVIRTTAQLSQDPLMSLEKIAIGGSNTVRGFSENLLVRDNGFSATIELQIPIPGFRQAPHPRSLLMVPFIDYGRSWDEVDTDPGSSLRNTDDARAIAGAGLGLIWQPLRGLTAQLFWGKDVYNNFDGDDPRDSDQTSDLQDNGFHYMLSYNVPF